MHSNMCSKVNLFEHNESMNIMKHRASLYKSEARKEKGWGQQAKNQKLLLLFLLFSLWSLEKIRISF